MLSVVKIVAIFALICWLTARRIPLGFSLLGGAVLVGLLFGMPPGDIAEGFLAHGTSPKTIELALMIGLIMTLSHLLQAAGLTGRMVTTLEALIRNTKARLAILPGLIGLLPMPGGALFSAPMVKEASSGGGYEAHHVTAINHWFRHVWEYCWPLYPGLILLSSLPGVELSLFQYCGVQLPLTLVAMLAGFIFVFGRVRPPAAPASSSQPLPRRLSAFLGAVAPIGVLLVVTVAIELTLRKILPSLVPYLPAFQAQVASLCEKWPWPTKSSSLVLGLMVSIGFLLVTNPISPREEGRKLVRSKQLWLVVFMAFSVKIFAGIVVESQAAGEVAKWLQAYHVPPLVIAALLPFLVGLIAGYTPTYVGVAYPLLLGLVAGEPTHVKLAYMVFAYPWGFTGVLLSPAHACLVTTLEYFQADMAKTWRWLIPASVTVLVGGTLMHLLLRYGWA